VLREGFQIRSESIKKEERVLLSKGSKEGDLRQAARKAANQPFSFRSRRRLSNELQIALERC